MMVGVIRLERTTSASRTLRATNCATPRRRARAIISLPPESHQSSADRSLMIYCTPLTFSDYALPDIAFGLSWQHWLPPARP